MLATNGIAMAVRMFATGLVAAGLRFPEKVIEREFRDYFRDRTYMIAQIAYAYLSAFV